MRTISQSQNAMNIKICTISYWIFEWARRLHPGAVCWSDVQAKSCAYKTFSVFVNFISFFENRLIVLPPSDIFRYCALWWRAPFFFFFFWARSSADADNRLDAFSGQSRSTNMVPFHMSHIASYCAIVTLSFKIFVFKKIHDLEMGVKGHSRSLRVLSFDRLCMVSY